MTSLSPAWSGYVRSDQAGPVTTVPWWVKGTAPEAITYLVFDVPEGTVIATALSLTAVAAVTGAWAIHSVAPVDASLTYANRPPLGAKLADVNGVTVGQQTITLPPAANGKVCLALVKAGGGVFKFTAAGLDVTVDPVLRGPQPWPYPDLPSLGPTDATTFLCVDTAGADSNSGAPDAPLRTIQAAVAAAPANAEIRVRPGVYPEAVSFAGKGAKRYWLRPDGPARFVIDGEGTRQFGIDTRGATAGVVIEGAEIKGFRNQGVILGDHSELRSSVVHDIFADWTTRAPLSSEDPNQSGVKVTGVDARVEDNLIHDVGQHGEARGILLLSAERCRVFGNHVLFARKEAIRDAYGGLDNEIADNVFAFCWAGISIETTMGTWAHHNVVQDCTFGVFTKHTAATTAGAFPSNTVRPQPASVDPSLYRWVVIEDNDFIRSAVTEAWLHDNLPRGDFVCFRRNVLAGATRRYILTTQDPAIRGPNFILDENTYLEGPGAPPVLYKGDGLQGTDPAWQAATLAELQVKHPDLEPYGNSFTSITLPEPLPVAWTRFQPVNVTVSHRPTQAARLIDGDPSNPWEAGTDAAGHPVDSGARITLDLGEPRTFTHILMHPWAHGSNQCPRSLDLSVSDDGVTFTTHSHIVFNDNEGSGYWWDLGAPVTARFVDFSNIVDFAAAASPPLTTRNGMQIGELAVACLSLAGHPETQVR